MKLGIYPGGQYKFIYLLASSQKMLINTNMFCSCGGRKNQRDDDSIWDIWGESKTDHSVTIIISINFALKELLSHKFQH